MIAAMDDTSTLAFISARRHRRDQLRLVGPLGPLEL